MDPLGRGFEWRGSMRESTVLTQIEPPLFLEFEFHIRYRGRECLVLDRERQETLMEGQPDHFDPLPNIGGLVPHPTR